MSLALKLLILNINVKKNYKTCKGLDKQQDVNKL